MLGLAAGVETHVYCRQIMPMRGRGCKTLTCLLRWISRVPGDGGSVAEDIHRKRQSGRLGLCYLSEGAVV